MLIKFELSLAYTVNIYIRFLQIARVRFIKKYTVSKGDIATL